MPTAPHSPRRIPIRSIDWDCGLEVSIKQYQNWLAQYLICHRGNDHAMAAELAESISTFWQARGDKVEHTKWLKVYQAHLQQTT